MIKLFDVRLLPLMCFVMSIGILASCKKESAATSDKVELLNFGPTGAKHGDSLRFFGHNLNKVTSIEFTGAGASVAQAAFIQQTSELILVKVPTQAEQGFVTLKTSDSNLVSKTRFNLKVASKVATMTMQAMPGENITLSGEFMNWVRRITFNRDKVVTSFVSQSMTQLVVKVPEDAQTGPLVLFRAGTDSMNVETKDTLKVALPMATSLAPNPARREDNVTISGTNLDLVKKLMFNGVSTPVTTFVSQSATQLVVRVPAATTKGKVTLEAASGVRTTSAADLDIL